MSYARYVFTGSRKFDLDPDNIICDMVLNEFLNELNSPENWDVTIQHGGAAGFDTVVHEVLCNSGWGDRIEVVRPDYTSFDPKYAPIQRNFQMVDWALKGQYSKLIAMLHENDTLEGPGGTKATIKYAIDQGLNVEIFRFDDRSIS